jgi:hypothetical protein
MSAVTMNAMIAPVAKVRDNHIVRCLTRPALSSIPEKGSRRKLFFARD